MLFCFKSILNCSRLSFLHLSWLLFQQAPIVPCHQDIQGLVSGHTTGRCFQAFSWCSPTVASKISFMESRYNLTADRFCVLNFFSCLGQKTFTVEEAVETIGFGRFHIMLFLIMGSTGVGICSHLCWPEKRFLLIFLITMQ